MLAANKDYLAMQMAATFNRGLGNNKLFLLAKKFAYMPDE